MPIGGGNKMNFEDEYPPISGKDEKPIGGKGGYNLDDLDMNEALGLNESDKPKKAPPARLA